MLLAFIFLVYQLFVIHKRMDGVRPNYHTFHIFRLSNRNVLDVMREQHLAFAVCVCVRSRRGTQILVVFNVILPTEKKSVQNMHRGIEYAPCSMVRSLISYMGP